MVFFLLDSPSPGNYLEIQRDLLSLSRSLKSLNHHLLLGNKKCFVHLVMGQNQLVFRLLALQCLGNHRESPFGNVMYRIQQSHCTVGTRLAPLVPSGKGDGPHIASHTAIFSLTLK